MKRTPQQQEPCPLLAIVDGFEVELVDPLNLVYEIRNINADAALSNWILELDACRFENCFVSEVFPIGETPEDPTIEGICEFPSQNNEEFACPPEDLECAGVITGLKFDNLSNFGELSAGFAQRFRIVLDSAFDLQPACLQLKFGDVGRCGLICAPVCVANPCPPCENTVDFCIDILIPAPFTFTSLSTSAIDVSCLQCCLEPCETIGTVPTPCGTELVCPVEINAVIALGCINIYTSAEGVNPNNGQTVNFCNNTTVCVDNVICYQCVTDPDPCVAGFFNNATVSDAVVTSTVTTDCGNTLVSVTGTINLPTC